MTVPNPKTPLISLVISGRNDGFVGDYEWRLNTSFNYLASNLREMGRMEDLELIFVDWGSQSPMHSVLTLSQDAKKIIRFWEITPELASELQKDSSFPAVLAVDAGIRRSRGQWVGITDGDILYTKEFLNELFHIFEGKRQVGINPAKAYISAVRHNVPCALVKFHPPIAQLDWAIHHLPWAMPIDSNGGFGGAGLIMMHHQVWDECSAHDERLIYWGWSDIEIATRVTKKYPWLNLWNENLNLFHMGHLTPSERKKNKPKENPRVKNDSFRVNGDAWGLANYELHSFSFTESQIPVSPQIETLTTSQQLTILSKIKVSLIVLVDRPCYTFRYWRWFFKEGIKRFMGVWRQFRGRAITQFPSFLRALYDDYFKNRAPRPDQKN